MKRGNSGAIASLFQKHEAKRIAAVVIDVQAEGNLLQISNSAPQFETDSAPEIETDSAPPSPHLPSGSSADTYLPFDCDPGKRIPISSYDVNDQDDVRRRYIAKGGYRSYSHDFEVREMYGKNRHFSCVWFENYHWLEYSTSKDAGYCFVCYLFKARVNGGPRGDAFVNGGWRNYHQPSALLKHEGGVGSIHNQAQEKYNLFVTPNTSIDNILVKVSKEDLRLYMSRLTYSLRCLRFLLLQGLAFRGHDESETSDNKGNFLELLEWLADNNEDVSKVVLKNAPKNCRLTSPCIQADIIECCAMETTSKLIEDLGDEYYAILADESSDVSHKEQLALCLRYVDKLGRVCERFLGVHVASTTSLSLKEAIETLLDDHHLSLTQIRGQGYDGASNMKGEIKGLKTLIMRESPSAYYIHCFAHQLQLVLVAVAKGNDACVWFFDHVTYLFNIVGVSCKRHDMIRDVQAKKVLEALEMGELESGRGLNQEMGLARPGDTRWGSHYRTILHIITLYPTILEVLVKIGKDPSQRLEWTKVRGMVIAFESFEFVFHAHLMLLILGYTNALSQSLQRRDQDIVNAMGLVKGAKDKMQSMRSHGWEEFLAKVTLFCNTNGIVVPLWGEQYVPHGRSLRFYDTQTNDDHFRRQVYLGVVDQVIQELDNRFDEVNMELLVCMSCLNPTNSFAAYDATKVMRLAEFYPKDISHGFDKARIPTWHLH